MAWQLPWPDDGTYKGGKRDAIQPHGLSRTDVYLAEAVRHQSSAGWLVAVLIE